MVDLPHHRKVDACVKGENENNDHDDMGRVQTLFYVSVRVEMYGSSENSEDG